MRRFWLWILSFSLLTFVSACGDGDRTVPNAGEEGEAEFSLVGPNGDCVTGTVNVLYAGNVITQLSSNCTQSVLTRRLLAGYTYSVAMAPGYSCSGGTPPDGGGIVGFVYDECQFIGSDPTTVQIVAGVTTPVAMGFDMLYQGQVVATQWYRIGGMNITMNAEPEITGIYCGAIENGLTCTEDETCAVIGDDDVPGCYQWCEGDADCQTGELCSEVASSMEDVSETSNMTVCLPPEIEE